MAEQSVAHSTFVIERSYPQPPDRVFAAFAQPARKRRWYAEGDHDIVPEKRIVITGKMSLNGKPISITVVTLEFLSSGAGTDLVLTNQGAFIDWAGGAEMIEQGWRALLDRLGKELAG